MTDIDPRNVFVVHGRNERARVATFEFLRAINLNPLEWPHIVAATGSAAPYIGDILNHGFSMAQAAVVLLTPDDEARLKGEFWHQSDAQHEREFTGQPRQNVLFEAGMALRSHENQTVIVELGALRPMSDTVGRHVLRMSDSVAARQQFAQRLRDCGCNVNLDGTDWHAAGDFQAAIAAVVTPDTQDTDSDSAEHAEPPRIEILPETNGTPTARDFVNVGEHLWYLCNPPRTTVDNLVSAIRTFLEKLDETNLRSTRIAATPLASINLRYDVRTNLVTSQSCRDLEAVMLAIRSALEAEAREISVRA